jgi:dihydrolipoamide dehydrogenase
MRTYDVIVVGAGDVGLGIAFKAASENRRVALIEKATVGGTCVNNGCVPSKTLIHAADRIMEIKEAARLGIRAELLDVDFKAVMERMRGAVASGASSIRDAIAATENIDFINEEAHFVDEHVLDVGSETVTGKTIFLASGSRPSIPRIKGLDSVPYLTNITVLDLEERPRSIVLIGAGYIGLEYAHFFAALGAKVAVLDRETTLLPFEEPEISELLKNEIEKRVELRLGVEITEVRTAGGGHAVRVRDAATGEEDEVVADAVMVAAGRRSNADLLRVENAGIETGPGHFIKVDEYLRTNRKHIWALGDSIGRAMFTHAGDREGEIAWHNFRHGEKIKMDFDAVPHAVFTHPQIAAVGLTEKQARERHKVLVGRARYSDTVMGEAMAEREGFAKAIVEKGSQRILGFHIIGPHASVLIQEVVNAVAKGGTVESVTGSMHIFPALSGLIPEALANSE